MRKFSIRVLVTIAALNLAYAEDGELDSASKEALDQTKELLSSPAALHRAAKEDPNAQKAQDSVENLELSKESNAELYKISGQILEKMVKDTKGDPAEMTVKSVELMKDPESLEKMLTPEQRETIRKLAGEKEAQQAPSKSSQ